MGHSGQTDASVANQKPVLGMDVPICKGRETPDPNEITDEEFDAREFAQEIAADLEHQRTTDEWTAASIRELAYIREDAAQKIADAHNAAIAAEREKQLGIIGKFADCEIELREQLAAAQAAIAKWKMVDYESDTPTVWLDAAIAAAQQPLVELLTEIVEESGVEFEDIRIDYKTIQITSSTWDKLQAWHAAKVKEGKK